MPKTFSDKVRDMLGAASAAGGQLKGTVAFTKGVEKMQAAKEAAKKRKKDAEKNK